MTLLEFLMHLQNLQVICHCYTLFTFTSLCENLLHDMHVILESLESDFKCALIDTKISQTACWKHLTKNAQYIAMA